MSKYTKSGFSKPFGCCSRWKVCDLGRNPELCVYKDKDVETMENCVAFQRNILPGTALIKEQVVFEREERVFIKNAVEEQLTLF